MLYKRRLHFCRRFIPTRRAFTVSKPSTICKSESELLDEIEPSKYALDNRRTILLLDLLLHLGPVTITIALIYLNVKSVYWSDVEANGKWQNNILNALQFAAKMHEIWIIISITAITSHFVVFFLANGKGLPFGLLGAGIQVADFSFFFRRAFWSSISHSYRRRSHKIILFATLLIISSILASLVGPSSAIAMRPDLDLWLMPNGAYEIIFPANKTELWPETVSTSTLDTDQCSDFSSASTDSTCPSGGFPELKAWSSFGHHSGPEMAAGKLVNLSFYEPYSNTYRQVSSSMLPEWGHSYTSSISLFPYIALLGLWDTIATLDLPGHSVLQPTLLSQTATPIVQPFVQVKCDIFEVDHGVIGSPKSKSNISFPLIPNLSGHDSTMHDESNTITVSGLDLSSFQEENNIHMSWVDLQDFDASASIGAVLQLPNNYNSTGRKYIVPCAVDARWISTELGIEPTTSQGITGSFGNLGAFSDLGSLISAPNVSESSRLASVVSDMIGIDLDWAHYLNLVTTINYTYPLSTSLSADDAGKNTTSTSNATIIEALLEQYLLHNGDSSYSQYSDNSTIFEAPDLFNAPSSMERVQAFISIFLGILITDGLARYTQGEIFNMYVSSEQDTNKCTPIVYMLGAGTPVNLSCEPYRQNTNSWKFDFWRHGYSYGVKSFTTRLALAGLLTHAVMALTFIAYLCFAGWTTKSWGSIGELVALALKSQGTKKFRGTDAGISRSETWAQDVRIMEAGDGGLEMRFGEGEGGGGRNKREGRVKVGKKYGHYGAALKSRRGIKLVSLPMS